MYNRYIPQPDGSYRRSRVAEPINHQPQPTHSPKPTPPPPPAEPPCPPEPDPPCKEDSVSTSTGQYKHKNMDGFLHQLLPKDFDIGDLLVILLLLLIAGDCPDERSNALLTLGLYFIL